MLLVWLHIGRDDRLLRVVDERHPSCNASSRSTHTRWLTLRSRVDPSTLRTGTLGAGQGGEKAYGLLAAAMREAGRVALAQFVSQGKERTAPHPKPPTLHCARSPRPSPGRGSHGREGYRCAARQAYAGSPQLVRERRRLAELGCS